MSKTKIGSKKKSLKQKLFSNQLTIGSWITLAHTGIAEIMAKAGFDWLAVDLEHSVITIREAEELIRVIGLCGVTPLVRLTSNDPNQIKRVMDAGAHGVIVPMVNSREQAEAAVCAVHYPVRGRRGVGLARAQGYGTRFQDYLKWLQNEAIVIVQIEHIDAVENLEEIFSVPGVNGYMIGPYDLSGSLGVPGQFTHPKVLRALRRIKQVAAKMKKPGGIHIIEPDPKELKRRVKEGFHFLAYSLDIRMLDVTCRSGLAFMKKKIT
ncbi:MAG: 2,4-dihydroxyhept-2-ene-1,7-dioic acid aldolase [Chlamydiae bacterium]|nr:2,4-dihydroxyhept-2-ene-1,7-dioic acid aldolase [Chlamydiota bacterium]MBI3276234.1 2,4-dihydroxyhept-2-ene-1,7-dioic acid aldolase [Chlamydiota bacterium]